MNSQVLPHISLLYLLFLPTPFSITFGGDIFLLSPESLELLGLLCSIQQKWWRTNAVESRSLRHRYVRLMLKSIVCQEKNMWCTLSAFLSGGWRNYVLVTQPFYKAIYPVNSLPIPIFCFYSTSIWMDTNYYVCNKKCWGQILNISAQGQFHLRPHQIADFGRGRLARNLGPGNYWILLNYNVNYMKFFQKLPLF